MTRRARNVDEQARAARSMMVVMDTLDVVPTRDLLRLYGRILDELRDRGIQRTRNAPLGDYAEYLAWTAFGGVLEPNSTKSHDITTESGLRIQVKARTVAASTRPSAKFSAFRSWDFHEALFMTFDATTYDIRSAVTVPSQSIRDRAIFYAHTNAANLTLGTDLLALSGSKDVSLLVARAQHLVDDVRHTAVRVAPVGP